MMTNIRIFSGGLLFCLISACGSSDDKDSTSTVSELEGTWSTTCFQSGTTYIKRIHVFTGLTNKNSTTVYSDKNCTDKVLETNFEATFEISGTNATVTGAKNINLNATKMELTPRTSSIATEFNSTEVAEYTDWKVDEAKNVNGKKQNKNSSKTFAEKTYTIFKIDGTTLTTGDTTGTNDGSTEALRPTTLNQNINYSKQ